MKLKIFTIILLLNSSHSYAGNLSCEINEKGIAIALVDWSLPQESNDVKARVINLEKYRNTNAREFSRIFGINVIRENSLESKYCSRLTNLDNEWDSVFNRNVGVPAIDLSKKEIRILNNSEVHSVNLAKVSSSKQSQMLEISANGKMPFFESEKRMIFSEYFNRKERNGLEEVTSLNANFIENSADWESLLELNVEGQRLWASIVEKSRELNPNEPEEEARFNYFTRSSFVKSKKENEKIIDEINSYKKEIFQFLDSTEMKVNYGLSKISSFDPFFVQVVLEFFVSKNIYTFFDRRDHEKNDYEWESLAIERNLYPDEIINEDFINLSRISKTQRKLLQKSNLISLMTMITSSKGCEHLGLRPEISRSLIQAFNPNSYNPFVKIQFDLMITNTENECGNVNYYKSNTTHDLHYSSSSRDLKRILDRYRDLALY